VGVQLYPTRCESRGGVGQWLTRRPPWPLLREELPSKSLQSENLSPIDGSNGDVSPFVSTNAGKCSHSVRVARSIRGNGMSPATCSMLSFTFCKNSESEEVTLWTAGARAGNSSPNWKEETLCFLRSLNNRSPKEIIVNYLRAGSTSQSHTLSSLLIRPLFAQTICVPTGETS